MKLAWHVQDPGITTNVHVRTPNDGGCTKHYQIKYAYCPPGEENELYVMSWISVNEEQSKLQTFSVSVLPGHHGSGIPQSNVIHESKRCNKYFMAVMNVLSVLQVRLPTNFLEYQSISSADVTLTMHVPTIYHASYPIDAAIILLWYQHCVRFINQSNK